MAIESAVGLKSDLPVSHLSVHPGQTTSIDIAVTNTANVIDGVTAIIDGIDPNWVRLPQPILSLFPETTGLLGMVFDIPRNCPAGDYLIVVRIVSTIAEERQTVHDFWLTVEPVVEVKLDLRPAIVTGGKSATIEATVHNAGNAEVIVGLSALEPTREVDCTVAQSSLTIPHGHEALLDVDIRGPRPWFGQAAQRSILLTATVDEEVVEARATFNQKPRIPRGLITLLILGTIVTLWALIFFWVISEVRTSDTPTKSIASNFLEGADDIPLANIASVATGQVQASTTGDGLARVTIEALRVIRDGETQSVGSAATDENGEFTLQGLLPGTYKFRASADGFSDQWFPNSPDEAGASPVPLLPKVTEDALVFELTGELGRLTGAVALPADAGEIPLTVTVTQQVERTDAGTDTGTDPGSGDDTGSGATDTVEPVTITQETTDGTIDVAGLPTPATYTVTVSGPGFDTTQFEQTLDGGDETVLNTVGIEAAPGSIAGLVVDGSGNPLGGVTVSARAGETTVEAVTPTSGNVGQFELIGLATPQTYVLTFEREEFSGATIALDLGAGEARTGVPAQLIGGSGTVNGVVVTADGVPIGGVQVDVASDNYNSTTATLTTGGAGTVAGSFELSALPIPGDYSLTFSADGLQTESLAVSFGSAGEQSLGNITMLSSSSTVAGTVTSGAVGVGEVEVTLSNGVLPRTTLSATSPAGVFAFVDVPPGSYTLTFTNPDFTTRIELIRVVAGTDTSQTVELTPVPS